jgi:hypothetical protein
MPHQSVPRSALGAKPHPQSHPTNRGGFYNTDQTAPSGVNLILGTRPAAPRLLRSARNDSTNGCHCEERSDEAISTEAR